MESLKTPKQHEDILKMISIQMKTAKPVTTDPHQDELKYQISIKSDTRTLSYVVISFREAEEMIRILNFFRKYRHPNVIDFYGHIKMHKQTFLVFEHLYISLQTLIQRNLRYYKIQVKIILYQILRALIFLHSNQLIHRDICPRNIMISHKGTAKLMGFQQLHSIAESPGETTVGTPGYQSPEVLNRQMQNEKIDVFGFGLIAYECFYAKKFCDANLNCFQTLENLKRRCRELKFQTSFQSVEEKMFVYFLKKCLVINPERREGAISLLNDPWFIEVNIYEKKKLLNKKCREFLRKIFEKKKRNLEGVKGPLGNLVGS